MTVRDRKFVEKDSIYVYNSIDDLPPADIFGIGIAQTPNGLVRSNGSVWAHIANASYDSAGRVVGVIDANGNEQLLQTQADKNDNPSALKATDYYNYNILCIDSRYKYGIKSGVGRSQLFRFDKNISSYSASLINTSIFTVPAGWGNEIKAMYITSVAGVVFAVIGGNEFFAGSKFYNLYKSTDYGATFYLVENLGKTSGVQIERVSSEGHSGFCESVVDNRRTLWFAEYNIASDRVDGGANDQVRLLKSYNFGETWIAAVTYNVDGKHVIRHMHDIAQNPYNKKLYLTCGDSNGESAIIIFDDTAEFPQNPTHQELKATPGFRVLTEKSNALQRHRATKLEFTKNHTYWTCDASPGHVDHGIWRYPNAFDGNEKLEKVDSVVGSKTGKLGWKGFTLDGNVFLTDSLYLDTSERLIRIYGSNSAGTEWKNVASITLAAATMTNVATSGITVEGNSVYYSLSSSHAAGKDDRMTIKIDLAGDFVDVAPHSIYPNFYVSDSGVDDTTAGRGDYPDRPWKTVKYALEGSRVTYGAVIYVDGDVNNNTGSVPNFSASSRFPAPNTLPVTIDGGNKDTSKWRIHTGNNIGINCTVANTNLIFKDITLQHEVSQPLLQNSVENVCNYTLIDALFLKTVDYMAILQQIGTTKMYRSELRGNAVVVSNNDGYKGSNMEGAGGTLKMYQGSLIKGFRDGAECGHKNTVEMYNSAILNYARYGIRDSVVSPKLRNSVIYSDSPLVTFSAIMSPTDDFNDIQYSIVSVSPSSVASLGQSVINAAMHPFADLDVGDYRTAITISGTALDSNSLVGRDKKALSEIISIVNG